MKKLLMGLTLLISMSSYSSCDLDMSYTIAAEELEISHQRGIGVTFWDKVSDPFTAQDRGKAQLILRNKSDKSLIMNREYNSLEELQSAARSLILPYNIAMQNGNSIAICENNLGKIEFTVVIENE